MDLLTVLRLLVVRRRRLLVLGAVVCVAGGLLASGRLGGFGAPAATAWTAAASVQIDTPTSLTADAYASATTIQSETLLLADNLTADASRAAIARAAGLSPAQLNVIIPPREIPVRPTPLVMRTDEAVTTPMTAYAIVVTPWVTAPFIDVAATGPDRSTAERLSRGAMATLAAGPANVQPPPARRLTVRPLRAVRFARHSASNKAMIKGVGVALFLFILWCGGIVVARGFARLWRSPVPGAATAAQ